MEEISLKVIQSFLVSLVFIYIVAKLVGEERKARWFKRRKKETFFTKRGFLGETLNFGHPVTWQGLLVVVIMYGLIFGLSYIYIFKW